jgi:hypothetical protein
MGSVDLFTISERIGFPALVIFFLSLGIYKVGKWFGTKLDPLFTQFEDLLKDHKSLINELKEHVKKNDDFIIDHMRKTETHLVKMNDQMIIMSELAQERNAYMKDTSAVYKYMNAEIEPKTEPTFP